MRKPRKAASRKAPSRKAASRPATKSSAKERTRKSPKAASRNQKKAKQAKASRTSLSKLAAKIKALEREKRKLQKQYESRTTVKPTRKQLNEAFRNQKAAKVEARRAKLATKAAKAFKASQKDYQTYVFIGVDGGRDPQKRSRTRKGYLLYIDGKGKKHLVNQPKYGYRATSFAETQAPFDSKTKSPSAKHFQASKRVKTQGTEDPTTWRNKKIREYSKANPIAAGQVRLKGELRTGGAHDFNAKAIKKLASSISKAIKGQQSHREFIIRTMALVRLPDGTEKVFDFHVDIEKADEVIIKLTGVEEFVRRRFYAYMARELSFLGFVTSGSANHIRSLKVNKGKPESQWKDTRGEPWAGRGKEIANLLVLEWKIEQAQ